MRPQILQGSRRPSLYPQTPAIRIPVRSSPRTTDSETFSPLLCGNLAWDGRGVIEEPTGPCLASMASATPALRWNPLLPLAFPQPLSQDPRPQYHPTQIHPRRVFV